MIDITKNDFIALIDNDPWEVGGCANSKEMVLTFAFLFNLFINKVQGQMDSSRVFQDIVVF